MLALLVDRDRAVGVVESHGIGWGRPELSSSCASGFCARIGPARKRSESERAHVVTTGRSTHACAGGGADSVFGRARGVPPMCEKCGDVARGAALKIWWSSSTISPDRGGDVASHGYTVWRLPTVLVLLVHMLDDARLGGDAMRCAGRAASVDDRTVGTGIGGVSRKEPGGVGANAIPLAPLGTAMGAVVVVVVVVVVVAVAAPAPFPAAIGAEYVRVVTGSRRGLGATSVAAAAAAAAAVAAVYTSIMKNGGKGVEEARVEDERVEEERVEEERVEEERGGRACGVREEGRGGRVRRGRAPRKGRRARR